ncbi:restriction endonuclease subunit S [Luteibacter pinisoli]|uniref:Restriction endonuclease subunit S n=1 Tax=Luteibacter pinisoli TaxID=2589080 RepID=A0A4Y5Z8R9_9GAMM|nr:restriction endonuclease subunit S [Luteibacter pinisoli]QDE40929.1 restriction endonuclease subunit S [Luteibacter pinisoli]
MSTKKRSSMTNLQREAEAIAPRLRFPEFRSRKAWDLPSLAEISSPVERRVGTAALTPVSISAGVGFVAQAEKFGRDISGNQYRLYTRIGRGDFVYNKGNSLKFPQGCIYEWRGNDEAAAPNVFICFRFKQGNENAFFRHSFELNVHGHQLKPQITSGARSNGLLNITKGTFFGVRMPRPEPDEQRKIASFLDSADSLISSATRKLSALESHKVGLISLLFPSDDSQPPTIRFPEFARTRRWRVRQAGTLFHNRSERGNSDLPIYSVTVNDGMVPRASLERRVDDASDPGVNKKVNAGDIAYNMMRMWQGALGVAPEECMVSPAYVVLTPQADVLSQYYYYYFKMPRSLRLLASHSRGLTSDRLRLYFQDFSRISLPHPAMPEQEKIARCLLSLDELISTQSRMIDALKRYKTGLMQKVLCEHVEDAE